MTKSPIQLTRAAAPDANREWRLGSSDTGYGSSSAWWSQHREASLNWLAVGLLLAAWNASDNDAETQVRDRPASLRGYSYVSVRAAQRVLTVN